jgi:hypothetical protein
MNLCWTHKQPRMRSRRRNIFVLQAVGTLSYPASNDNFEIRYAVSILGSRRVGSSLKHLAIAMKLFEYCLTPNEMGLLLYSNGLDHRKPFLPWVRGTCVGGDEGEETPQSLSLWVTAWGETTGGHYIALSRHPPRTSRVESVGARMGEESPDDAVPVERAAGGRRDRCRRRAPAVGARSGVGVPEADRGGLGGDGKHDGGEFRLVEVALIAVIEDSVPEEFIVCGDVMVCDHAVEPQVAELHLDVASDEGMKRGWWVLWVAKSRSGWLGDRHPLNPEGGLRGRRGSGWG